MSNHDQTIAQLIADFETQFTALADLLTQENQALRDQDSEAILALNDRKQAAISEIEQIEQSRADLSQQTGHPTLSALLQASKAPNKTELEQQLTKVKACIKQCQQQNQVNGTIITVSNDATTRLRQMLHGSGNDAVYSPEGKLGGGPESQQHTEA